MRCRHDRARLHHKMYAHKTLVRNWLTPTHDRRQPATVTTVHVVTCISCISQRVRSTAGLTLAQVSAWMSMWLGSHSGHWSVIWTTIERAHWRSGLQEPHLDLRAAVQHKDVDTVA